MRMQPIVPMLLVGCRLPEKSEVVGEGGKPLDDVMVYAICMKKSFAAPESYGFDGC